MIPKIIHYCWFGGNPLPEDVKKYIATWRKQCPDYEIKEWNESNFDVNTLRFTKQAYKLKKFAFVSDVARITALVKEGGIYLDTDVELIKSLDSFLDCHNFVGLETEFKVRTAVIGAEKGSELFFSFLKTYYNKKFVRSTGRLNSTPNTILLTDFLNSIYPKYKPYLDIYGTDILCAKNVNDGSSMRTSNTVAIHHLAYTWKSNRLTIDQRLKNILSVVW